MLVHNGWLQDVFFILFRKRSLESGPACERGIRIWDFMNLTINEHEDKSVKTRQELSRNTHA